MQPLTFTVSVNTHFENKHPLSVQQMYKMKNQSVMLGSLILCYLFVCVICFTLYVFCVSFQVFLFFPLNLLMWRWCFRPGQGLRSGQVEGSWPLPSYCRMIYRTTRRGCSVQWMMSLKMISPLVMVWSSLSIAVHRIYSPIVLAVSNRFTFTLFYCQYSQFSQCMIKLIETEITNYTASQM